MILGHFEQVLGLPGVLSLAGMYALGLEDFGPCDHRTFTSKPIESFDCLAQFMFTFCRYRLKQSEELSTCGLPTHKNRGVVSVQTTPKCLSHALAHPLIKVVLH